MSTALHDPPTRLLNVAPPPVGPPSEPIKPPGPFSFDTGDTGKLLEPLECLRSTAAGTRLMRPKRRAEDRSARELVIMGGSSEEDRAEGEP